MSFRDRLRAGEVLMGPWCVIPSVEAAVAIASCGMDFVIIDMEHGAFDSGSMSACIHAVRAAGSAALVRPSGGIDAHATQKALDAGADGVVIPGIKNAEDAHRVKSHSRYFPDGSRGFSPFTPAGAVSASDSVVHRERSNRDICVVGIVETPEAFDEIDAIVAVGAFDAIYVGAYDLSVATGYAGDVEHPDFKSFFLERVELVRACGVPVGGYVARTPKHLDWLLSAGISLITCEVDLAALVVTYSNLRKGLDDRLGGGGRMTTAIFIPARLESSRLDGKVLLPIAGLPMLVHVVRRCGLADVGPVYVATDSAEVAEALAAEDATVVLTSSSHRTGSDRIAEAVGNVDVHFVINVQGDEAMVRPEHVRAMDTLLRSDDRIECALLTSRMSELTVSDIKVVTDLEGRVLYLSRAEIPFHRDGPSTTMLKAYHVVGFRRDFLLEYAALPRTPLEEAEYNEYLRILEHGRTIYTKTVSECSVSVDTQEDLDVIRSAMPEDDVYQEYAP